MRPIKWLEKDYTVVQTEYDAGWISFWIKDPHGNDVKSFSSSSKALKWWESNKEKLLKDAESPAWRKARREAEKLVRRMGGNLSLLPEDEQKEWIEECL